MKLNIRTIIASFALAAAGATSASAAVVSLTGALTSTDSTFNRPSSATSLSGVGTAVAYDLYTFTAASTGPYSLSSNYTAGGLDGYLFLYSTFNPASGLSGLLAGDDDSDPDGAGPATALQGSVIPSSSAYGPSTTTTTLTLVGGTTYTIVQTAFDNATVADGLGPYTITVTGAAVPEPSSVAAVATGLSGLGLVLRRRRRALA